jgi:hypothetical protein
VHFRIHDKPALKGHGFPPLRMPQNTNKSNGLYRLKKNPTGDMLCNKGTTSVGPQDPQNQCRALAPANLPPPQMPFSAARMAPEGKPVGPHNFRISSRRVRFPSSMDAFVEAMMQNLDLLCFP